MPYLIVIGLYILCCVGAYFLFKHTERQKNDFTTGDRCFYMTVSLFGPSSCIAAVIFWVTERSRKSTTVIAPKFERKK